MFRRTWALWAPIVVAVTSIALAACGGAVQSPTPTPTATGGGGPTATQEPTPTATAPAFDAAAYFGGKTITLIVDNAPGGGTDTQARFLANELPRFIPGNPRITVSNLTPNITAANRVWRSAPDGFTLLYAAGPRIVESLDPAAEFEADGFGFIGAPDQRDPVWFIKGDLPYTWIGDARGASGPTLVAAGSVPGAQALTGVTDLGMMMLADFFDLPFELKAVADSGGAAQLLMFERGDINGWLIGAQWHVLPRSRPGWLRDNVVKPFADASNHRVPIPPNAEASIDFPNVRDLMTPEQQRLWDGLMGPDIFLGKNLRLPPGASEDVLATLRQAWVDFLADPETKAAFEQVLGQPVVPTNGEEGQQQIKEATQNYKSLLSELQPLQERLYAKYVR